VGGGGLRLCAAVDAASHFFLGRDFFSFAWAVWMLVTNVSNSTIRSAKSSPERSFKAHGVPLLEASRPLPTKDGGILRTIRDACSYMTGIGKQRELRSHWQRTCKLILAKEDVLTVSRALELALFMDAKLDVSKVPG
jgi:hypothetical protein